MGYQRKIDWQIIKQFVKAVALSFVLVLPILIPFMTDFIGKGISTPIVVIAMLTDFDNIVLNSLANRLAPGIGLLLTLAAIFSYRLKNVLSIYRVCIAMGVGILVISTSLFPWHYLVHTPLAIIQMPNRYLSFAGLFLAVAAAKVLTDWLVNQNTLIVLAGSWFVIVLLFLSSATGVVM